MLPALAHAPMSTSSQVTIEIIKEYGSLVGNLDVSLLPASVIAFFAFQQFRVNRLNLRLGLYNKRFDVFKSFLAFVKAVTEATAQEWAQHDNVQGDGAIRKAYGRIVTAREEAAYLFDPNDGINDIIAKAMEESVHIEIWARSPNLPSSGPERENELLERSIQAHANIHAMEEQFKKRLVRYLSFSYIIP
jgi:hypothetical protein